jgi:hypothetical protein
MKHQLAILSCLIVLITTSSIAQDGGKFLSMTVTPSLQEAGDVDKVVITISNASSTALTIGWDGDDFRIMLIDDKGGVVIPNHYSTASQGDRRPAGSTYAQVVPPQGSIKHCLSLRQEIRQDISPGTYWLMVMFKHGSWAETVLTAPAVRINVGQKRDAKVMESSSIHTPEIAVATKEDEVGLR